MAAPQDAIAPGSETDRLEADKLYNERLTALDVSLPRPVALPPPLAPFDDARLDVLLRTSDVAAPPASPSSVKGRVRQFIGYFLRPFFATQRQFNSALVDHLKQQREAQLATAQLLEAVRAQTAALQEFHSRLIWFAQTITGYVDTKDRAWGGQDLVNAAFDALADDWLKRWESLGAREQRFLARVAAIDDLRTTVALAQQTSLSLKRDVERLLAAGPAAPAAPNGPASPASAPAPDLNAFKYLGFEDAFRGSRDEIRARLAEYVPLFAGRSSVLDIGCGRGEFLDLLRAAGIGARGLDINQAMVETARARGLAVDPGDALAHVRGLTDGSLDGVFSAQVVEHLDPAYLTALLEALFHKLQPGGIIVLETINPACWLAFFESYIRDITHVRALHPDTLQYLLRVSGFQDLRIELRSPVPDASKLQTVPAVTADLAPLIADLVDAFNENAAKLNARMFTFQDYAVIGRK